MALTAEVVQLDDARRARTHQFTVVLSSLVTSGDHKLGLITVTSNPETIEYIETLLANPDFAAHGDVRDELAAFARKDSFRTPIGPFLVFYSICRNKNQLEIESVFLRKSESPNPKPSKFNRIPNFILARNGVSDGTDHQRRRLLCIAAAAVFLAAFIPCLYLSIQQIKREHGSLAALQLPAGYPILFSKESNLPQVSGELPVWLDGPLLSGYQSELGIVSDRRNTLGIALGWHEYGDAAALEVDAPPFTNSSWGDFYSHLRYPDLYGFSDTSAPIFTSGGERINLSTDPRGYLISHEKLDCERTKNKAEYHCSLVIPATSKAIQRPFKVRIYFSDQERESKSNGVPIRQTSFALDTVRDNGTGHRVLSLVVTPDGK